MAVERLYLPTDRLLLAISGGLDSCVLAGLLQLSGANFGLAHVNFGLREEADGDEHFVRKLADYLEVPVYVKRFATKELAIERGLGIQELARDLRYEWLENVREQEGYDFLLTAHHLDDNLETLLLNLLRGTGPSGLRGILPVRGVIKRPLLDFSRADLEEFAAEQGISWREDASNAGDAYARNRLRHHILPLLHQESPRLARTAGRTFAHLRETEQLYRRQALTDWNSLLLPHPGGLLIDRQQLQEHPQAGSILFEGLAEFGFTPEQQRQLIVMTKKGKIDGPRYRAYVSKQHIEIIVPPPIWSGPISVPALETVTPLPNGQKLRAEIIPRPISLVTAPREALTSTRVTFPLTLDRPGPGDRFRPYGQGGGRKKIGDYFTNRKISHAQRDQALLLRNGDAERTPIWLIGHRLDDRFKVRKKDKEVVRWVIE
ncbi:MAG: tRNA lysidine(34) synthetase TilS [Saprospiraceae bacterium]